MGRDSYAPDEYWLQLQGAEGEFPPTIILFYSPVLTARLIRNQIGTGPSTS